VQLTSPFQVQHQLRVALYRFDCPPPQTIGDYGLDLLVDPDRRLLAQHVVDCAECARELTSLRVFLATETSPALGAKDLLRRVLATLLIPTRGGAPFLARGSERPSGLEYRAGPIRVVLGVVPARRRGTVALDGLVLHDTAAADAVAGRDVTLFADDVQVSSTQTDDLGNFAFDAVAVGTYQLEIHFADEVVVIDCLDLTLSDHT